MEARQRDNTRRRPSWLAYYVTLPYAMLAHEAWLTLKPTAKVILIDFKRHCDRMTIFGKYPMPRGGIPFAHGHCIDDVHRNTFYATMHALEDRGFVIGTDQVDIDGTSTYYLPNHAWTQWRAPEAQQKRIERLKKRIIDREARDRRISCTISVHPPSQFIDNPLLKFWADPTAYLHKKSAPPHYDQIRDLERDAHARAKQEQFELQPPENPIDTDTAVAQLAEWRARQNAVRTTRTADDAAAIESMRAFPSPE